MLRHDVSCINDLVVNRITKRFAQSVNDDLKGPTTIVPLKMFNVFENECSRFVILDDVGNFEKQIPLSLVCKAVLPTEAQFLRDTGD